MPLNEMQILRLVILTTVFLSVFSLLSPAYSAQVIPPGKWRIVDLPDQKIIGNQIHFNKTSTLSSSRLLLDLDKNKLVSIYFPEMEGVFTLKITVFISDRGENKVIEKFASILPSKGKRKVRFDFTSDPLWIGKSKKIKIGLAGKNGSVALPMVVLEPPTIPKRLAIFVEKWKSPIILKGLATNLLEWPYFFGIPLVVAIGGTWFTGIVILLFYNKFCQPVGLSKAIIAWSLMIWICIDLTQKWSAVGSLERIHAMKGHYSDALGPYEQEAKSLASLLERNGIKHINFFGDSNESIYLRYALLPIRIETEIQNNPVMVLGSFHGIKIEGGRLTKDNRILLHEAVKLGSTDMFTVFSGKLP